MKLEACRLHLFPKNDFADQFVPEQQPA